VHETVCAERLVNFVLLMSEQEKGMGGDRHDANRIAESIIHSPFARSTSRVKRNDSDACGLRPR
jgi:hypothetical protein